MKWSPIYGPPRLPLIEEILLACERVDAKRRMQVHFSMLGK